MNDTRKHDILNALPDAHWNQRSMAHAAPIRRNLAGTLLIIILLSISVMACREDAVVKNNTGGGGGSIADPLAGYFLVAGDWFSYVSRPDGFTWGFGSNYLNELGNGNNINSAYPTQVRLTGKLKALTGGNRHGVAIKEDGGMWAWGTNTVGQVGNGDVTGAISTPVDIGWSTDWATVHAGSSHTLALKTDGTLWSWGNGTAVGYDVSSTACACATGPARVNPDANWISVAGGWGHSLAAKADGTIWSWGVNSNGQLGHGDTTTRTLPTKIGLDTDWERVSVSDNFSIGFKTDGSVWFWGGGATLPNQIGVAGEFADVETGNGFTLYIKSDGTLWSSGMNGNGQLGLGDLTNRAVVTQVSTDTDWGRIDAGVGHSLAMKTNGTVWSFGVNNYGQLGLGDLTRRTTPTLMTTFP